jgi:hemolysin III
MKNLREPVNAITHLAGASAALLGLPVLLFLNGGLRGGLSLVVYGASLVVMFLSSGIYHAIHAAPQRMMVLRKLDHSAIYLLIAGTYTPFCLIAFDGFWKWGFLSIIWSLAAAGILVKMFVIRAPRWVTAGVYILMGWLSVFAMQEMTASLPAGALFWLVSGGIAYTVGAGIYITRRLDLRPGVFGFHEVWHLFVLAGAAAHYIAIAVMVYRLA